MIRWMKDRVKFFLLKKRFVESVLYFGAEVDKSSVLGKNSVVFANTVLINSTLGAYSYIQKNSEVVNTEIGKFCSIASTVSIGLANHPTNLLSTSPAFYDNSQPLPYFFTQKKYEAELSVKTIIDADVWIGQGAMLKAGVNVGVGAVIGAGAIVTKDVEPYSIVAGVPARHVKYRFDKELREGLIASTWWELNDKELTKLMAYFDKPSDFLREIGEL